MASRGGPQVAARRRCFLISDRGRSSCPAPAEPNRCSRPAPRIPRLGSASPAEVHGQFALHGVVPLISGEGVMAGLGSFRRGFIKLLALQNLLCTNWYIPRFDLGLVV